MERLFVYGTLLRGQPSDGLLAHLDVRPGTMQGHLWRVPAGYPALQPNANGDAISGELMDLLDPGLLLVLDILEGVGEGFYNRERHPVLCEGQLVDAWVYVMHPPQLRIRGCSPLRATDWRTVAPRGSGQPCVNN